MDPNGGRKRNVQGSAKVEKRGEGVGGGPVGRADGYAGRKAGSGRESSSAGGTRFGGKGILYLVLALLLGGGGGTAALFGLGGGGSDGGSSTGTGTGVPAIYSGFLGGSAPSAAWNEGMNNTGKLNSKVAEGTPEKRTTIIGENQDTVTIMVYMCGTDLESRSGMASNDLAEMMRASLSENVNIIVYTGGCNMWRTTGISNKVNQIYKVESGKMTCIVDDDGDKKMTDPNTLSAFIKFCDKNYPANRYDLIFWDHGGGSISGYGYDEKHKEAGSMDLTGINKALKDGGVVFDFVGFDACLMATLETGLMVGNYADYMIASEETEPGIGWYYTDWLNALSKNTSMPTIEIGKNIVDGFVDECNRKCPGQKTTLSVVDLAELRYTVPSKLNMFSQETGHKIKSDSYKDISDARASTREFAVKSAIDQVDLVDFATEIGSETGKDLSDALLSAIKYNRTSSAISDAYGLSIFFPYKKTGKVSSMVASYNAIGMDAEYGKCIQSFAGLESTGQIAAGGSASPIASLLGFGGGGSTMGSDAINSLIGSFLGGGKSIPGVDNAEYMQDESLYDAEDASAYVASNQFDPSAMKWEKASDGTYTMALADEQWELIQSLQVNKFLDDGEGYIDLGLDNVYEFSEDGKLLPETDGAWMSIDGHPIAYYYETTAYDGKDTVITGRSPVLLDGERADLVIVFDGAHPEGFIAGARYAYEEGETETEAKLITEIEEGTKIDFLCDYYDYDGNYQANYFLGDSVSYSNNMKIYDVKVEGTCKITYLLTDIYNQEYWTPAVPTE